MENFTVELGTEALSSSFSIELAIPRGLATGLLVEYIGGSKKDITRMANTLSRGFSCEIYEDAIG